MVSERAPETALVSQGQGAAGRHPQDGPFKSAQVQVCTPEYLQAISIKRQSGGHVELESAVGVHVPPEERSHCPPLIALQLGVSRLIGEADRQSRTSAPFGSSRTRSLEALGRAKVACSLAPRAFQGISTNRHHTADGEKMDRRCFTRYRAATPQHRDRAPQRRRWPRRVGTRTRSRRRRGPNRRRPHSTITRRRQMYGRSFDRFGD
jgi:hypothetical protein